MTPFSKRRDSTAEESQRPTLSRILNPSEDKPILDAYDLTSAHEFINPSVRKK